MNPQKQPRHSKPPLLVVCGPTAVGKTALAVELAIRRGGEVVSADSMQIYRRMNIGTAKPDTEEMRGIPHHLMDFLDPGEAFSVADYVERAGEVIADIIGRGKLPIVAGGTGLYISSLIDNISYEKMRSDPGLRAELEAVAAERGNRVVWDILKQCDPELAERLHPNNLGRVIRGIEVYRLTGVTMTEQQRRSRLEPSPYGVTAIGLYFSDRKLLYDRIGARVDKMLEGGLLEETERLMERYSATASQAIGYKELFPYFRGECSLEEAAERIKRETRRYAKRQLTWFRRDERIRWLRVEEYEGIGKLADAAERIIDGKGFGGI